MKIYNAIQIIDGDVSVQSSRISFACAKMEHARMLHEMANARSEGDDEPPAIDDASIMRAYDDWISDVGECVEYITDLAQCVHLESFVAYFDLDTLRAMERDLSRTIGGETDSAAWSHACMLRHAVCHMINEKM